jgi:hypothetical protein
MADGDDAVRREALASVRAQLELFERIPDDRSFTADERRHYERLTRIEQHLAAGVVDQTVDLTAPTVGLRERRAQGSGAVDSLSCRLCGETTPLDAKQMKKRPSGLVLSCASCRGEFPIRHTDAARLAPQYAHLRRRGA